MKTALAFDHVHVFVADRPAAERWYQRVLGLCRSPELEHWAVDGGPLTLQDETGAAHIALFERAAPSLPVDNRAAGLGP
jgi:catechol 2,3-dioxygenase-like lactoylglutathione lyase family enzyme